MYVTDWITGLSSSFLCSNSTHSHPCHDLAIRQCLPLCTPLSLVMWLALIIVGKPTWPEQRLKICVTGLTLCAPSCLFPKQYVSDGAGWRRVRNKWSRSAAKKHLGTRWVQAQPWSAEPQPHIWVRNKGLGLRKFWDDFLWGIAVAITGCKLQSAKINNWILYGLLAVTH